MREEYEEHPGAWIDHTAKIGVRTRVWQFATVTRGAVIGEDCVIGSCAIVDAARVGDRCKIGHGAQLHPGTTVFDDVFVGPGAICCNDVWPRTHGEGFDSEGLLSGRLTTVLIGRGASLGAGVIVLPGVVIGEQVMVAAGAVVRRSVPDGVLFNRDGTWESIRGAGPGIRARRAL